MNITAYGGGTNSTAMLIGLHRKNIPIDLILFAYTGGEQPYTYEYIPIKNAWLTSHGMPEITVVEYTGQNGERLTLERNVGAATPWSIKMEIIELEHWKPSDADPRKMEYAGQRSAVEVFEELKQRLGSAHIRRYVL